MKKPILVVGSQFAKEIEDRIDRDYDPRRSPNTVPFSREQLSAAADGTDAIFVTPLDRLAKSIALLPHGAVVVNTERGGLVVDEDLNCCPQERTSGCRRTGRIRWRTANPSRLS